MNDIAMALYINEEIDKAYKERNVELIRDLAEQGRNAAISHYAEFASTRMKLHAKPGEEVFNILSEGMREHAKLRRHFDRMIKLVDNYQNGKGGKA